jgi:hypothetical protein
MEAKSAMKLTELFGFQRSSQTVGERTDDS